MSYPRKTTAAFAFAVAFALAIGLTAFLRLRPFDATPELIESSPATLAVTCGDTKIPFHVEQAIVDFDERQSITTLKLDSRASDEQSARVWVWTDYYELAPAVMGSYRWTSRPQQIDVTGERRLRVVAECSVCDERPAGKPTFYARTHVTATRPDAAAIEQAHEGFDVTNSTPVVVQGLEE